MFAGALVAGLAAMGPRWSRFSCRACARRRFPADSSLILGAASAALPLENLRRVKTLPYINDITTDTRAPPRFSQPRP